MGSLVPGWDAEHSAHGIEKKQSFTQDEIKAFWKSRHASHKSHEEFVNEVLSSSPRSPSVLQKSFSDNPASDQGEDSVNSSDWWMKSQHAFLNTPPVEEAKQGSYVPQFDVAAWAAVAVTSANPSVIAK
eukprot:TRINITY_DN665_c0_g1_i10.p1 TRINITY_DN665_c0_g1~~TRINITY_DN665_c0_g1_i10.p1  ORF type:complete len:129 (-),score=7.26 TRINITY_DN665_c0_g1_i10:286-672(-)